MKIGIQNNKSGFSKKWIEYCEKNNIDYQLIDMYADNAIEQLKDCDAFMWHTHHLSKKDYLVAKRLMTALEHSGKVCFPSIYENWHYDDKVAQKYLLEAIEAPLIPSYVFYDQGQALKWAEQTTYPKVFKLTGGAGSSNVKLIKSLKEAEKIIKRSFGRGYSIFNQRKVIYDEAISKYKNHKSPLKLLKHLRFLLKPLNKKWVNHTEKNYVYFQEFLPQNDYDMRILVINQNKIFGYKRFNRKDDFRASGSGQFEFFTPDNIDEKVLKIALKTARKLKMNSVAYDFVYDLNQAPKIIEITYAFGFKGAQKAPGYWDENFKWHEGVLNSFQYWMVENVIEQIRNKVKK